MQLKGVNHAAMEQAHQVSGNNALAIQPVKEEKPVVLSAEQQAVVNLNQGVLENVDDFVRGGGGSSFEVKCYGRVDNTGSIYYPDEDRAVQELTVFFLKGKRIYQKYIQEEGRYDTREYQHDKDYKLKLRMFYAEIPEGAQSDEDLPVYGLTLPTTSALTFAQYIKELANKGLAVNQVRTKMKVRVIRGSYTFAVIDFEALDYETGKPLGVKAAYKPNKAKKK